MIPVEICHYTKKRTAIKYILPKKRLKLGQIKFTNDPKESMIRTTYGEYKENEILEPDIEAKLFSESIRVHDEEWKVMCFTVSRVKLGDISSPKFQKDFSEIRQGWNESELPGYNHSRMWDQYAQGHTGVCLVFDGVKLDQLLHEELGERCEIFSGMVRYGDIRSVSGSLRDPEYNDIIKMGPTEAIRNNFYKHYEDYFLKKSLDWERETEFRWLVHSARNGPEYVSILGALKGVIVGMYIPREEYEIVKSLCEELNVPTGKMGWQAGFPIISFN